MSGSAREAAPLLRVRGLTKQFSVRLGMFKRGEVSAVDDVSFDVQAGQTLGIVGESGCGKSTTARLVLRLIEPDAGDVLFEGRDVRHFDWTQLKAWRRSAQMVFQDPYSSVNPRMSVGENVGFPLRVHGVPRRRRDGHVIELLESVGLHPNHAAAFPHQLSGGQLQRVNVARAIALEPKLVICDEPVSALDKSIQAQVLGLLRELQTRLGLTYVFISHDLNVVEYMSDHVLVMYLGQIVEACTADELYREPLHPYTRDLLASIPRLDPDERRVEEADGGELPSPLAPPSGCRFRTRCPFAMDICATARPTLRELRPGHAVACYLYEEDVARAGEPNGAAPLASAV